MSPSPMSPEEKSERERWLHRFVFAPEGVTQDAEGTARFTQDSPVLPDVWFAYFADPGPQKLLINPFMGRSAGLVAKELRDVTEREPGQRVRVAHLPGIVAATLTFTQMMRITLPATVWWESRVRAMLAGLGPEVDQGAPLLPDILRNYRERIAGWMVDGPNLCKRMPEAEREDFEADRHRREFLTLVRVASQIAGPAMPDIKDRLASPAQASPAQAGDAQAVGRSEHDRAVGAILAFCRLYGDWDSPPTNGVIWNIATDRKAKLASVNRSALSIKADAGQRLFDISCARINWAIIDSGIDISSPAFRDWGDGAEEERARLQEGCEEAARLGTTDHLDTLVADAGIEDGETARADAFVAKTIAETLTIARPLRLYSDDDTRDTVLRRPPNAARQPTRIIERYDFTGLDMLLDLPTARSMHQRIAGLLGQMESASGDDPGTLTEGAFWAMLDRWAALPADHADVPPEPGFGPWIDFYDEVADPPFIARMMRRIVEATCFRIGRVERQHIVEDLFPEREGDGGARERDYTGARAGYAALRRRAAWELFKRGVDGAGKQVMALCDRIDLGLENDWSMLETFLNDRTPERPRSPHGTQVAGVLAADWRTDAATPKLQGVCPDIRLYDMRISEGATAHEFEAIAAMQFILHLNARASTTIHGANVSLSVEHRQRNYGCGKTRICNVAEQLVASGVVVVVAAGNAGTISYETQGGARFDGYQDGSITDPGNAETVITVGSTHATKPHQYGVSYFSSRGPTGDGRRKPDIVAPGEKLLTPGFNRSVSMVDGTSFAAPHVSGAAALLMARHTEMIGEPARLKRVLLDTATDLGRDPNFQGAGMLDTLRALQSL